MCDARCISFQVEVASPPKCRRILLMLVVMRHTCHALTLYYPGTLRFTVIHSSTVIPGHSAPSCSEILACCPCWTQEAEEAALRAAAIQQARAQAAAETATMLSSDDDDNSSFGAVSPSKDKGGDQGAGKRGSKGKALLSDSDDW